MRFKRLSAAGFSAVACGVLFTAAIQSSSVTIFTVIGFVSAELVTFPQALGINIGATLGTTSTPWLVAIFGFHIRIALVALPILGIGAFLWIVGRGRSRSLAAIGIVMTIVMQSSTAAATIHQIDHFLESISLDTIDPSAMELRLVRLSHALDHLSTLERELGRIPPAISSWQPPVSFDVGVHTLAAWLDASSDPNAAVDPVVPLAIHEASIGLSEESSSERDRLLGDIALKRTPVATARGALDALAWAEGALYDAWRLAESLQTTAAHDHSPVVGSPSPERNVREIQRPDRPGPVTGAA